MKLSLRELNPSPYPPPPSLTPYKYLYLCSDHRIKGVWW